jgi:hypothetical protein
LFLLTLPKLFDPALVFIFFKSKTSFMLVIAHHDISDPQTFWGAAQKVGESMPANLKLHSVFPSKDMKTGTCVWEAPSVNDVQSFIDEKTGSVSKNTCYEVDEQNAVGAPKMMADAASAN